eukprot:SAG31_NODE_7156_length_1771_cov_7.286483_4_plen_112_part_01
MLETRLWALRPAGHHGVVVCLCVAGSQLAQAEQRGADAARRFEVARDEAVHAVLGGRSRLRATQQLVSAAVHPLLPIQLAACGCATRARAHRCDRARGGRSPAGARAGGIAR